MWKDLHNKIELHTHSKPYTRYFCIVYRRATFWAADRSVTRPESSTTASGVSVCVPAGSGMCKFCLKILSCVCHSNPLMTLRTKETKRSFLKHLYRSKVLLFFSFPLKERFYLSNHQIVPCWLWHIVPQFLSWKKLLLVFMHTVLKLFSCLPFVHSISKDEQEKCPDFELSKTVATFIVQKILLFDIGLSYICATPERFYAVASVLLSCPFDLSFYMVNFFWKYSENIFWMVSTHHVTPLRGRGHCHVLCLFGMGLILQW